MGEAAGRRQMRLDAGYAVQVMQHMTGIPVVRAHGQPRVR
jgi:hypothetical protein